MLHTEQPPLWACRVPGRRWWTVSYSFGWHIQQYRWYTGSCRSRQWGGLLVSGGYGIFLTAAARSGPPTQSLPLQSVFGSQLQVSVRIICADRQRDAVRKPTELSVLLAIIVKNTVNYGATQLNIWHCTPGYVSYLNCSNRQGTKAHSFIICQHDYNEFSLQVRQHILVLHISKGVNESETERYHNEFNL